jgi:predicted restriction endonuclease
MPQKKANWTEDEIILALALYYRLKPSQFEGTNTDIIELSQLLGRTPGSVSRKLANLLAYDNDTQGKGLSHGSHWDRELTQYYLKETEELFEKETFIKKQFGMTPDEVFEAIPEQEIDNIAQQYLYNEEDSTAFKKIRKRQYAFRQALLTGYNHRCCLSGIGEEDLLIASHIIPWCEDKEHRGDPTNGLLLNALLDRAFDRGLITIKANGYLVQVSNKIKDIQTKEYLQTFKGREINLPQNTSRFPNKSFLEYHNDTIFEKFRHKETDLGSSFLTVPKLYRLD